MMLLKLASASTSTSPDIASLIGSLIGLALVVLFWVWLYRHIKKDLYKVFKNAMLDAYYEIKQDRRE